MIIPVVTGDIDAGAVEELIALCVRYHRLRTAPGPAPRPPAAPELPAAAAPLAAMAGPPAPVAMAVPPSRPG